jgi:hypothetical protein
VNVGTHRSELTHDGFGRRVRQAEKENGLVEADVRHVWIGSSIEEQRETTSGAIVWRFTVHGEAVSTGVQRAGFDETLPGEGLEVVVQRVQVAPVASVAQVTVEDDMKRADRLWSLSGSSPRKRASNDRDRPSRFRVSDRPTNHSERSTAEGWPPKAQRHCVGIATTDSTVVAIAPATSGTIEVLLVP